MFDREIAAYMVYSDMATLKLLAFLQISQGQFDIVQHFPVQPLYV